MLMGVLLIAGCNSSSSTRRVSVAYPEHWPVGEYRNCIVDGITDVVNGLPELDCDRQTPATPRSRVFVMDVEFSGRYSEKGDSWTCQKSKESLVCRRSESPAQQSVDQLVAAAKSGNKAALQQLTTLATGGDALAQYNLGLMYANGEGAPMDWAKAAEWYQKAAERGDAVAQNDLGVMYDKGEGVPQDRAQAAQWYRRAAEQGDRLAQRNLGAMYYKGEGVPKDLVKAYMWWNLVAAKGEDVLGEGAKTSRDEIEVQMTAQQIAEAQELSREWKRKR